MAHMQAVGSGVEANVEYGLSLIYHFPDLFLICHLGDQASCLSFLVNSHLLILLFLFRWPFSAQMGQK